MTSGPDSAGQRVPLSRAVIVSDARALLAADGLAGLSLRRLASGLGVTAPALYAHFSSKDDLLSAVADEEFGELAAALEASTAGLEDPVDRLVGQSHAYVAFALAHPVIVELMTVYRPEWLPQPAAPVLPMASRTFDVSSVAIRDAIEAGLLRDDDPIMVGLTLWAAVHGVATVLLSGLNLGEEYEARLVDSVIDSIVRALLA